MEHWQYDTFKVLWRDRSLGAEAFVTFSLNAAVSAQAMLWVPSLCFDRQRNVARRQFR